MNVENLIILVLIASIGVSCTVNNIATHQHDLKMMEMDCEVRDG